MGIKRYELNHVLSVYAILIPVLFFALNYCIFSIEFNIIEFLMVIIITVNTLFFTVVIMIILIQ